MWIKLYWVVFPEFANKFCYGTEFLVLRRCQMNGYKVSFISNGLEEGRDPPITQLPGASENTLAPGQKGQSSSAPVAIPITLGCQKSRDYTQFLVSPCSITTEPTAIMQHTSGARTKVCMNLRRAWLLLDSSPITWTTTPSFRVAWASTWRILVWQLVKFCDITFLWISWGMEARVNPSGTQQFRN